MAERCQAIARSGKPCGATVVAEGMCAWHAPSWDAKRRQWSAKGGERRSNKQRAKAAAGGDLMTVAEVQAAICRAIRRAEAGSMDSGPAQALGGLARTYAALMQVADFDRRLSDLEAVAGVERRFPA